MSVLDVRGRGALAPASALPLAYFAFAHLSLAAGLAVLAASPGLPGAFFYHPKMIALVHLLTLGWITGSILGSFHVVAPLALVMPMPTGWRDWAAFASFVTGTIGMIAHFWIGTYDGMAWSAGLVLLTIAHLAWRAARGLRQAPVPGAVVLHIALAFVNAPKLVFLDELTQGLDPQARHMTWDLIRDIRARGTTVVLVTHFMDEAEQLCDRVAIVDHGRIVALDTPRALIAGLGLPIRVRFSTDCPDLSWLERIPVVQHVERHGSQAEVAGTGAVLALVAAALVERGIVPVDLRAERPTLEDAFLALTGRPVRD